MIIYELGKTTVEVDSRNNIIRANWFGFVKDEDFKKVVQAVRDYATKHQNITTYISDTREGKIVSLEAQKWLLEEYTPNIFFKHTAVKNIIYLKPEDIFRQSYVDKVQKTLGEQANIVLFLDDEQALKLAQKSGQVNFCRSNGIFPTSQTTLSRMFY